MSRFEDFEKHLQTLAPNPRNRAIKTALTETIGQNSYGKFASAHWINTRTLVNKEEPKGIFMSTHFKERLKERLGEDATLPDDMGHKISKGRCAKVKEDRYVSHIKLIGKGRYSIIGKLNNGGTIVLLTLYKRLTKREAMQMLKEAGAEGDN